MSTIAHIRAVWLIWNDATLGQLEKHYMAKCTATVQVNSILQSIQCFLYLFSIQITQYHYYTKSRNWGSYVWKIVIFLQIFFQSTNTRTSFITDNTILLWPWPPTHLWCYRNENYIKLQKMKTLRWSEGNMAAHTLSETHTHIQLTGTIIYSDMSMMNGCPGNRYK